MIAANTFFSRFTVLPFFRSRIKSIILCALRAEKNKLLLLLL